MNENECGALLVWYWEGETENPPPLPLCQPQILHGLVSVGSGKPATHCQSWIMVPLKVVLTVALFGKMFQRT